MLVLKLTTLFVVAISWVTCSSGGDSTTFRKQDDTGNYEFGYDINDGKGGNNFHKEKGDEYGNKRGSYGILGADGKMRIVHYIADKDGFRVDIKSNEPGMKNGVDSANAVVNGKDPEHHSDYSSEFGLRTPGYSAPKPSPLYLSSSSHYPASKPYYPSALSYQPPVTRVHSPSAYVPPVVPTTHSIKPYAPPSIYSSYANRMHLLPKNLVYSPKPVQYAAPLKYTSPVKYGSIYDDGYVSTNSRQPPQTVHPVTYNSDDYSRSAHSSYDPSPYSEPLYGLTSSQADAYQKPSGYGMRKSAAYLTTPNRQYTKESGYEKRKHHHTTKYIHEPLDAYGSNHLSATTSAGSTTSVNHPDTSILRPTSAHSALDALHDQDQLVASYRTVQSADSMPLNSKSRSYSPADYYKKA